MKAKQPTIFDEFQRYHIPNDFPQWYDLEPTFGLYSIPMPAGSPVDQRAGGGRWPRDLPNNNHRQQQAQEEQPKKKIRTTSAYALFFHERQTIEKMADPSANNFGRLSQKISEQWGMLSVQEKKAYKARCEGIRNISINNAAEEKARQLMAMTTSS